MNNPIDHLRRNHQRVPHRLLCMSIIFLLPRSLFLLNFSIDDDRFLLKMYIYIHIDIMSVCECVSRLALYIRFFPGFIFFYMCLSSKVSVSFLLKKTSPIIVLLLLLSTGLSHAISTVLVFLLMIVMIMLVFEA
jgi:hypothetical protein